LTLNNQNKNRGEINYCAYHIPQTNERVFKQE